MKQIAAIFATLITLQLSGQSTIEVFQNTAETFGINIALNPPDPEGDCTARLWYEVDFNGKLEKLSGFEMARVKNRHNRISGSLLSLPMGYKYERIHVDLTDPTTPELNGKNLVSEYKDRLRPETFLPYQQTYYVSPDGRGSEYSYINPGNLNDVLKLVKPQSIIRFKEGTYYIRNLNLSNLENIGFAGENDKVIFSGLDTAGLTWNLMSGSSTMYYTTTTVANPNLVYYNGVRLYPFRSLDEMNRNKIGIGFNSLAQPVEFDANMDGFYRNPSTNPLCNNNWQYPRLLYVKLLDGSNPAAVNIKITAANHALQLSNCKNISVSGIRFQGYGVSPVGKAIELINCNQVSIENCVFAMNDIGLLLSGSTSRTVVRNCEFFDGNFNWSAWKIKATYDDYNPYSCVFPYYSRLLERGAINFSHGYSGRGVDISKSQFHDYAQAGHLSPPSVNDTFPHSYEIDFYENLVYRCFEDGFEIDGDARNIRVHHNEFEQINAPVSLAVAKGGPTYIYQNLFTDLKNDTFTTHPDLGLQIAAGHPFKTHYGSYDTCGDVFFINNTVDVKGNNTALDMFCPGVWQRFWILNNIFLSDSGLLINYRTPSKLTFGIYNNFFASNYNTPKYIYDENYNDADIINTSNWQLIDNKMRFEQEYFSGLYVKSDSLGSRYNFYIKPAFTNRYSNPYYLDDNSEAIRTALTIPGISGQYFSYTAFAGAFKWDLPENVGEVAGNRQFVFPNPNAGILWFSNNLASEKVLIQVFGIDGRLMNTLVKESGIFSLEHQLPAGNYFVQLSWGSQVTHQKLIVLQE